ncbi:carboxypeptidase regulatory-like domain-containing protein [Cupriavidus necator]
MKDGTFLALAVGATIAAATAVLSPPAHAVTMPSEHTTSSGVPYVAGGIGQGQADALRSMRDKYNLRMTFARARTGEYLSDIRVQIEDMHGKRLVDALAPGPLFYARLPDGNYRIFCTFDTQGQTRQVAIKSGRARDLVIYFAPASMTSATDS